MVNKALIVVTSVERYPNAQRATGLWLSEAVHFAEVMEKAGWQIDVCSPKGGYTPLDPACLQPDTVSEVDWKYYSDPNFRAKLGNALKPEQVNSSDYRCIYFAGGHGTLWDFPENTKLQEISRKIYENNGVVSAVCHGVVGLLNIKLTNGSLLLNGKKVTGFSNKEENLIGLTSHVPFLTEDSLKQRGGKYEEAQPFTPFAVADGRLVTGQNPSSGKAVAEKVLQAL